MLIQTERFGALTIDDQTLLSFDNPLIGFHDIFSYVLHEPTGDNTFIWLQAATDYRVALPLIETEVVYPTYPIKIHRGDLIRLGTTSHQDKAIRSFAVVTLGDDPKQITANFAAPVLVHFETRKAIQLVVDNGDYGMDTEIFDALRQAAKRGFFDARRLVFGSSPVKRVNKATAIPLSASFRRFQVDDLSLIDDEPSIH